MTFKTELYEVVRGAISKDLASFLAEEFELIRKNAYIANGLDPADSDKKFAFGDHQIPKSFSHYSPFCFETLSIVLKPMMEEITGKSLHSAYSYARIYYNGSDMKIHKDRPSCEYSLTINLTNDTKPWEIWFKNLKDEDVPISLEPGDLIIYKGTDLLHWRNEFTGKQMTQAFVHYVDANGPYAEYKYDKRPYLGFSVDARRI